MKDARLVSALEEVASMLGVKVSYENIKKSTARQPKGGLCYVRDLPRIIVHKPLPASEKAAVLTAALGAFDLESLYITPEVRRAIEGIAAPIK